MNTQLLEKIKTELKSREHEMIEIRRHLHENPELSYKEFQTVKYIEDFYKAKDCILRSRVGGNGITVDIIGGKIGKSIALRADFDALPITEQTGLPFASKNEGVMHACGHDAHTAYMMILADVLIKYRQELAGTIRIIHQHGEEVSPGGAKCMIDDNCLENIDHVLGIHVISTMETGKIGVHAGASYTGMSVFDVMIQGRGGHGSSPHEAIDPIVAGANFVMSAQTIVSRRLNPSHFAVLSIGYFDAKGATNVIQDSVKLGGTVRFVDDDDDLHIKDEFMKILDGTCRSYNCKYEVNYERGCPTLYNDEEFTKFVSDTLNKYKIENTEVFDNGIMTFSEDFSYYAQRLPCCFISVGAMVKEGEVYAHHHPKFDISEETMLICANVMATVTLEYLES